MWRACVCFVFLFACGPKDDRSPLPARRADMRVLEAALAADASGRALEDVDHAIEDQRPVLGAELIRTAVVPALRRTREAVAAATVSTREAVRVREEALRVFDRRLRSVESFATLLDRGVREDAAYVEALREERVSEQGLVTLHEHINALDDER